MIDYTGFTPDKRSIFLNSLKNNARYVTMLTQGEKVLELPHLLDKSRRTSRDNKKIETAFNILLAGINKERASEQQYFDNFIENANLDGDERAAFKKQLSNIFSEDSFNYMAFISLINQILVGAEQYESIIKLELERQKELQTAWNTIDFKKIQEWWDENPNSHKNKILKRSSKKDIKQHMIREYEKKHTVSGTQYEKMFDGVKRTIDTQLAKVNQEALEKIMYTPSTLLAIKEAWDKNSSIETSLHETISANMAKETQGKIKQIVEATLKNALDNEIDNIVNDLIETLENGMEEITTNGDYVGIHQSKNAINYNNGNFTISGEQFTNTLQQIITQINTENLTNEKYSLITSILNGRLNTSIFQNQDRANKTIKDGLNKIKDMEKSLQDADDSFIEPTKKQIAELKRQISRQSKKYIEQYIRAESEKNKDKTLESIINEVNDMLRFITIKVTGPSRQEFIDTIIQQIATNKTYLPGASRPLKADALVINIGNFKTLNLDNTDLLKDNTLVRRAYQYLDEASGDFYENYYSLLPSIGQNTDYKKGKQAWSHAVIEMQNALKRKLDKNEKQLSEVEKAKIIAQQMKDTIIVTETMKNFNFYNNDIGFLSGSLGGDLSTQIENFGALFEAAGVGFTKAELGWLEYGIVNCSAEALGSKNKDPIERYLSILAGFAIFDEGSAEIESMTESLTYEINGIQHGGPQIMHLYNLNGTYYPGSFILQRIYDHLTKTISEIDDEIINNDGAHISAYGSGADIAKEETERTARWRKTYQSAKGKTRISVAFLSGLLNIMNQLNEPFNN